MKLQFTSGGAGGIHALCCFDMTDAEACMALGFAEAIVSAMRKDEPPPEGALVPATPPHAPQVLGCQHGRKPGQPCPHCLGIAVGGLPTRAQAKTLGYEGDPCADCGQFMLVRNGTCLKCDGCGATTGCS